MGYKMKVAIIGATGAVGREMISELEDSSIKDIEVGMFASPRSEGTTVEFRGNKHTVKAFSVEALSGYNYALMSAGGGFSREFAKALSDNGTVVIDNSSAWRMDPNYPLVVPEVNAHVLKDGNLSIIANPNCSTIQMMVNLAPLEKDFGLDIVQVSTYQSVSGTGQKGLNELAEQVREQFNMSELKPNVYPQPIAFNVLPAIGPIDSDGHAEEEVKMVLETKKILENESIDVLATTVRVPVFSCHSESIVVKLNKAVSREEVIASLKTQDGLIVVDSDEQAEYPTPLNVSGKRETFVTRVRLPFGVNSEGKSEWVQMWNVADNLKKGAATNAVQILEKIIIG
jgi:aspartate-semialdehyde dehydrogenase